MEQVLQALIFRNTFSSRPFLPARLVPSEEIMTLLTDISEVTWPGLEDDTGCVTRLEDGSVKVSSLDGHAHLYMTALQKEFTVKYLCQLSCMPSAPGTTTHNKTNADPEITETETTRSRTIYSSCVLQEASPLCQTKHASQYTWLVQRFSVADCPQPFQYPMGLAFHLHKESVHQSKIHPSARTEETVTDSYFLQRTGSVLPHALPLTCSATHMHRLGFCNFSLEEENLLAVNPLPLKVVIYTDILYRLILDGTNLVEIHPGDGSVFISEGECIGKYFKHWFMKEDTKQVEDRLYSARDLPPDKPRALYSVRSIISQAKRFLECCCKHKLSINPLAHTCCWKTGSGPDSRAVAPVLLEQSFIPNQGRFAVYSNSTVCASYLDGVLLYMIWNFANLNTNEEDPTDTTFQISPNAVRHEQFPWFSLRFPNGSSKLVEMEDPGEYASYIRTAMAWCRWLDEKTLGDMVTPVSTETELVKGFGTVARELEKIQRFNFLLEHGSAQSHRNGIKLPSREDNADGGQDGIGEINIQSVLEKTSKAIQDIDLLLSCRK
ncbi:uncharacterized protein C5orf34 homolog isoform X2 [Hyla sarda]|uniref:uncharacterized protein C5orf34 homolog isoform X2 n=1 Tax=Hyla sarda TaxID=327740 RepID=UPI0024C355BD|nr:uncharacterized protein C5orf34 homolog isoform X2 [Hyla sarda]